MGLHRLACAGLLALSVFIGIPEAALSQGASVNLGIDGHDGTAPVEITSESLSLDQESGTATFVGDVIVRQGEMTLSCERMVVEYSEDTETGRDEIDTIRLFGGVTFASPSEAAESESAVYSLATEILEMSGNVLVTQGPTAISADTLTYNLETGDGDMRGNVKTVLRQGSN